MSASSDSSGGDQPRPIPDAAAVRILPPIIPLVAVVVAVLLEGRWPLGPGAGFGQPYARWAGRLIAGAPLVLAGVWAVVLFVRSGQDPSPHKPTPSLIAAGPYRVTRNPMYLTMVLVCLGFGIMRMNVWLLALTPVVAWLLQRWCIQPEEAYLEARFGDEYRAYRDRVRRWL